MFSRMICLIVGAVTVLTTNVLGDNVYHDIAKHILDDYDKRVAPVHTDVKLELGLRRITEFDVNKGILVLDAWFYMHWYDDRLSWKKGDYENKTDLTLPSSSIWIPDINLYDSASGFTNFDDRINVFINDSGSVYYVPPTQFKSYCKPGSDYDGSQNVTCQLKFGTWTYNGNQIDLNVKNVGYDLFGFKDNFAGWSLMGISSTRNVAIYACCPDPYVDITYSITLHADNNGDHDNEDGDEDDDNDDVDDVEDYYDDDVGAE